MSKVYVKFPKAGLGNLLLVWARASVFAHLNNLPLVTSSWWAIRPGAWIRNERKKRLYWGYFKESRFLDRMNIRWYQLTHPVVHEPPVKKLNDTEYAGDTIFLFDQVITDNDLFGPIRNYVGLVRDNLYNMLSPSLKARLKTYESPVIAIHIRRGDFKGGNPITPESFFVTCINYIRSCVNENWPVTVFTDAAPDEIQQVLALQYTKLSPAKADILDVLLMSKSRIIITSRSSTFSYWAAFLSEAIVIRPSGDWQKMIRNISPSSNYEEINLDFTNNISINDLNKKIINATNHLTTKNGGSDASNGFH